MLIKKMRVTRCEINEEHIYFLDEDGFAAPVHKRSTTDVITKDQSDVFLVETDMIFLVRSMRYKTFNDISIILGKKYHILGICPN